jgi:anti-sigma factor RsiW
MNSIDETTLLRFASGELDAEQEATLLAQCELAPESWREAVLAVVEQRRMVEVLGELAAEDRPSPAPKPAQRIRDWRVLPVAAAALVIGLAIGIVAARMTGLGGPRATQVVQTPQPATAPARDITPPGRDRPETRQDH